MHHAALAQNLTLPWGPGQGTTQVTGPPGFAFTSIGSVINRMLPYIVVFAGIGLLLMIISAGFSMLTSAGDPKKMDEGKQRLTHAIIGLLIILLAFWITQIAGNILGFTQVTDSF